MKLFLVGLVSLGEVKTYLVEAETKDDAVDKQFSGLLFTAGSARCWVVEVEEIDL